MKNYLTLILALAIVSSPAYASRARLEALGEGKNGSYYIDDSRNMFLNPASIVKYKKKMMLELGSPDSTNAVVLAGPPATTTTYSAADNAGNSRAQGGFTNTFGDFTYALYLNNTSDTALNLMASEGYGLVTTLNSSGAVVADGGVLPSNAIEFQLAGEGSVNWGLAVT
ncbi:MAG: hypothetical protein EBX52_11465, partial [Proteobacteria bacterium]|nr:hypothetical protein [Pseudomonadota bacterium]